jgi:hypothetical protein
MRTRPVCCIDENRGFLTDTGDPWSSNGNHREAGKDLGRAHQDTIVCPHCNKEAKFLAFWGGWVRVCCNELVHNDENPTDKQAD